MRVLFTKLMVIGLAVGFGVSLTGVIAEASFNLNHGAANSMLGAGLAIAFSSLLVFASLSVVAASRQTDAG